MHLNNENNRRMLGMLRKEIGSKKQAITEKEFRQVFIGSGFYVAPKTLLGMNCLIVTPKGQDESVCAFYLPSTSGMKPYDLLEVVHRMPGKSSTSVMKPHNLLEIVHKMLGE